MLSRLGLTAATGAVAGALPASAAEPQPQPPGPAPMALNVQDFGAVGDGKKDNTEAFAAAMKAAAETGNGAVFVPRGRYLIQGSLTVPEGWPPMVAFPARVIWPPSQPGPWMA